MSLASDALLSLGAAAYVAGAIALPVWLQQRSVISAGSARKAVHLFAGLAVVTVPYFEVLALPLSIALAATIVTLSSRPRSTVRPLRRLYEAIAEPAESGAGYLQGPFHYCLAITVLVLVFALLPPELSPLAVSATLLMIVADPLASLCGRRWGRRRLGLRWTGSERTLVGSATFGIAAFAVSWAYLWMALDVAGPGLAGRSGQVLEYAIAAAVAGTVIEAVSPSAYDDLTVPLGVAGVLLLVSQG